MSQIVLLTGSVHENGSTTLLANAFEQAASLQGHEVFRFNAGMAPSAALHPLQLTASNQGVPGDDLFGQIVMPQMLAASAVVLVTPVYFGTMASPLKMVMERLYAYFPTITGKQCALIAAARGPQAAFNGLELMYHQLLSVLNWHSVGNLYAPNCSLPDDLTPRAIKAAANLATLIK